MVVSGSKSTATATLYILFSLYTQAVHQRGENSTTSGVLFPPLMPSFLIWGERGLGHRHPAAPPECVSPQNSDATPDSSSALDAHRNPRPATATPCWGQHTANKDMGSITAQQGFQREEVQKQKSISFHAIHHLHLVHTHERRRGGRDREDSCSRGSSRNSWKSERRGN